MKPVQQNLIVGPLRELHFFRDAPGERLLVQRDVGPVLHRDLEGLLDQEIALARIGFHENLVGEFIELLVAIAGAPASTIA